MLNYSTEGVGWRGRGGGGREEIFNWREANIFSVLIEKRSSFFEIWIPCFLTSRKTRKIRKGSEGRNLLSKKAGTLPRKVMRGMARSVSRLVQCSWLIAENEINQLGIPSCHTTECLAKRPRKYILLTHVFMSIALVIELKTLKC